MDSGLESSVHHGGKDPILANTGKYRKKQLVDDTNNVGFECGISYAGYIDVANWNGADLMPGQTPRRWHQAIIGHKALA